MKDLNLHEQIIKSLNLMVYDRSLTLSEQGFGGSAGIVGIPSYKELSPEEIKQQKVERQFIKQVEKEKKSLSTGCNTLLNSKSQEPSDVTAKKVFLLIRDEVGEHWYNISSWGTNEKKLLNALKLIKDKETYNKVLEFIDSCYPESAGMTIMEFLQSEEFSGGQVGLEKRAKNATKNPYTYIAPSLGPVGIISSELPAMASWYLNDAHLKAYQQILQKFNKNETYYQENPYKDEIKGTWDKISKSWKTQMPPFAREVFHNATMLASIALAVFSGGSLAPLLISAGIDLVDAAAYMAEGDPWMAGFCLVFAILPIAGYQIKSLSTAYRTYKSLKNIDKYYEAISKGKRVPSEYAKSAKGFGKFSESMKKAIEWITRPRNLIRVYKKILKLKIDSAFKNKGIRFIIKLIINLVSACLLTAKFLTTFGLKLITTMGPVYITWSWIASILGIEEKSNVEKKDMELTFLVKQAFSDLDPKTSLSTDNGNVYNINVLLLQLTLYGAGYTSTKKETNAGYNFTNGILTFQNAKDVKTVKIYNVTGKLVDTITNNNNQTIKSKKLNNKEVLICVVNDSLNNNIKIKIQEGSNGTVKLNKQNTKQIKPKWGYYDNATKEMVKNYQTLNGLKQTGIFDNTTKQSLIDKIKEGKITRIRNISNQKIDAKTILKLQESDLNKLLKQQYKKASDDVKKELDKLNDSTLIDEDSVDVILSDWNK